MDPQQRPAAPITAFIGLGGNLDNPLARLPQAMDEIAAIPGIRLIGRSSLYRSAPVGYAEQPDFINAAVRVYTTLSAGELLDALLAVERQHGRQREFPNAPRTLDLDVLLYGEAEIRGDRLHVPHPRMAGRAFVLLPLLELDPALTIPGHGSVRDLAARCHDQRVTRVELPTPP